MLKPDCVQTTLKKLSEPVKQSIPNYKTFNEKAFSEYTHFIGNGSRQMDWRLKRKLIERLGKDHFYRRLHRQKIADRSGETGIACELNKENILYFFYRIFFYFLKKTFLFQKGVVNTLDYQVINVVTTFPSLPKTFNGLRILQLSDLHIRAIPDNGRKLCEIVRQLQADMCVFTGDFHLGRMHPIRETITVCADIIRSLNVSWGIWGILGNHDPIQLVPELEDMGCRMLMNESICIEKSGENIWIIGIDDAHFFHCDDLNAAMARVPENAFKILLAHSPQNYADAAQKRLDFMLCGHTHGGQICFRKNSPLIANARCPKCFTSGPWLYEGMKGYTCRGIGVSAVPVRFGCTPEITLHELRREADK